MTEMTTTRPNWDEIWAQMAEVIGQRSRCDKAKVGCVIVANDQTVVSCSYNGPPPGYDPQTNRNNGSDSSDNSDSGCSDWCRRMQQSVVSANYDTCPSSHAEANGICRADRSRTAGAVAYISGACCMTCAKLLASAGVVRVVHKVSPSDNHRNPETVEQFLRDCGVECQRYVVGTVDV